MAPLTLALALLLLQYPYPGYPGQSVPRGRDVPDTQGTNTGAVATFNGKFKSADKKYLFIEMEEGQTLRMYITHGTKFFRDDKESKASDFRSGERVTVEAARDARLNMLAVRITALKPRAAPDRDSGH